MIHPAWPLLCAALPCAALLTGCGSSAPTTWRYTGPEAREEVTGQAVALLTADCDRLKLDRPRMEYGGMSWIELAGHPNAVMLTAKMRADFSPRLKTEPIKGGDEVLITLVSGQQPGYVLRGGPAHYFCKIIPPPGRNPTSIVPQPKLQALLDAPTQDR